MRPATGNGCRLNHQLRVSAPRGTGERADGVPAGKLNTSSLRDSIEAGLSETGNFTGIVCWVFETHAHAAAALKVVPLSKWLTGDSPVVRVHDGNVIIVASGYKGADKQKLDAALAAVTKH